ncbi:PIN domain-containing protein [Halostagnicola bangensis]
MKLLDTTFLIHYWAGRDEVRRYLESHEESESVTTTLNIKEITVGRELKGQLDPFEIRSKFEWLTIVPFRVEHSVIAGELEATLHRDEHINRDKMNFLVGDALIGAVAKEIGATVVTQDDFQFFDDVAVESC